MENKFTNEEIKTAKQVQKQIFESDSKELKAVYMAGEICMWLEMQENEKPPEKVDHYDGDDFIDQLY